MSREFETKTFNASELTLVPDTGREVIFGSGGPIMQLETVEGDQGLCSWRSEDGSHQRHLFALVMLRRIVRITPRDFPDLRA